MEVFVLHHIRDLNGEEDVKLIGLYSSRQAGTDAIIRLSSQPGFRGHPDGFHLEPYEVDRDHWAEGFTSIVTIYVRLIGEGTDVWRPVEAEHLGGNLFRILSENQNPDDETWEFSTGQAVRCKRHTFADDTVRLVATENA